MLRSFSFALLFLILAPSAMMRAQDITWHDPIGEAPYSVRGRGWADELAGSYHRLPDRAQDMVTENVWNLSKNSAGEYIEFSTDANDILVEYTVEGWKYSWNQTAIGVSGVDLYMISPDGTTRWCAAPGSATMGQEQRDTVKFHYKDLVYHPLGERARFKLFLPLYNTVSSMRIGVPEGCAFDFPEPLKEAPIVAYGTSICQGASASRPAMAWTNIISRKLDLPVVNLGFSGNGMEHEAVFRLMAEIPARLYIIDCMPNMYPMVDSIYSRTLSGVAILRRASSAPILLVENDGYCYGSTNAQIDLECLRTNEELRKAYDELMRQGVKDIHYLSREDIGITPDAQVDGWHASDVGMELYARAYLQALTSIDPELAPRLVRYRQE